MILSFITPIFNEENYLNSLFQKIDLDYSKYDFEWIFIDDHSTDKSYEIIEDFAKIRNKIKLIKNKGKGKIDAINEGVKIASGKYIKLVGGDDEINLNILDDIAGYKGSDNSFVHNAKIIDEKNNLIGKYIPPYQLFNYDLDDHILQNISCPSWCWIFPREKAKIFFPIPPCEYEDLYLSFCIKKYTKVNYIKKYYYNYRQNPGQTFGNVLKFNDKIGNFRSKRSLKSLSIMKNSNVFNEREKFLISQSRLYFIYYIKKKNIFKIITSKIPLQRKVKLVIFRYFYKIYGFIQQIKYKFDDFYLRVAKQNLSSNIPNEEDTIENKNNLGIRYKKTILLKSCLAYPSSDGLTNQYYDFIDYFCSKNDHKIYLFCKKNFKENDFIEKYPNLKSSRFIKNYPNNFAFLTVVLILYVLLHKLKIKENKIFTELEEISLKTDYSFYIHDISFYPLLLLKIKKKKIIFSITDFQVNRLFKLIFISKNIFKSLYYLVGFIHCVVVESFVFKSVKKLHVYSKKDNYYLKKYFFYKNSISIPNFNLNTRDSNPLSSNNYHSNSNKILIMGDLNQIELYQGIIKLKNMKYFNKFEKKFTFVVKGKYDDNIQQKLKKIFTNCQFSDDWIDKVDYLKYLDSFKVLLFLDRIDFGLSNRVADALNSKSLIVGFNSAFTGYQLKNFKEAVFINNFFDLVYAFNLKNKSRNEIINNANLKWNNYGIDIVKSTWNSIL